MDSDEENCNQDSGSDWEGQSSDDCDNTDTDSSSAATGCRKPYKILKDEDIKNLLQTDISTVSGVLSVPRGIACSLLCRNSWSLTATYDQWFAAADKERNPNPNHALNPAAQGSTNKICEICYEFLPPEKMVSAACGHPFCADCWKQYIETAISAGAGCLTLRCPEPRCKEVATSNMVEKLSSEDAINQYNQYLRRSYVELSRNRKWCPAAGCDRAVEYDSVGSDSYDVACDCSHKFCWSCAQERHRPLSCKTVAEWAEKNRSEAENTTWILAYTKPCPKCRRAIEKNQGCNHMTCRAPCRYEFCWICSAPWPHGGDYYSCNNYKEKREVNEEERNRKKAKAYMQRYAHYYERWDSNDKARKRAMADLERARGTCEGQVGMKFIVEAWEQVVECRHVLKWSYVYGYYLSAGAKKVLFEYLQGEAEAALERLHHCVEKEMVNYDAVEKEIVNYDVDCDKFRECKIKLMDLTRVTSNYFENLVVALENDLVEVESFEDRSKPRRITL